MPLFEFECSKCKEVIVKLIIHGRDIEMPVCQTESCDGVWEKIMSSPSMVYDRKYKLFGKEWG